MLASFLKCIGHIIPLMDAVYANYYTREVMFILVREFQTPDEEMKKIVLKVVQQCVATEGVEPQYIRTDIMAPFFANFWVRRMALDRRNYRALVDTTVSLANKVGCPSFVKTRKDQVRSVKFSCSRGLFKAWWTPPLPGQQGGLPSVHQFLMCSV